MPQEDNKLNDINDKLQIALEKQASELGETIDNATKQLVSGIQSSNLKFVDELDAIKGNILDSVQKATGGGNLNLEIDKTISLSSLMGDMKGMDNINLVLAFKFLKVKSNILKSIDKATNGGNLRLKLNREMKLSDLLGESPKLNMFHAFRWLRIKKNILKKVEKATESVDLEIDPKMSLNDVLGSTPDQDILTKTRFFLIRQGLLNKISKAAKKFDPQQTVDNITSGLGAGDSEESTDDGSLVTEASQSTGIDSSGNAITSLLSDDKDSSGSPAGKMQQHFRQQILKLVEMIENSTANMKAALTLQVGEASGDRLDQRENRKEDIARQEEQIEALNNIGDNDSKDSGSEKKTPGGVLSSIKDSIKSKLGGLGGGAKAAAGKAGGTAMSGLGKGAGKGMSGFLRGLGKGLKALSNPKYLIGAGVLIALGGALIVTAKGLKGFVGIDFKQVALGVTTLGILAVGAKMIGKSASSIFVGALAIGALGASLIPAAFAFGMFSDVNWTGVGIGIGVLTALGAAAFGLSFIAPAIFIGALAIAALGAAMIPAAFAFNLFGSALATMTPFITAFGNAVSVVISSVGSFLTGFIDSLVQLGGAGAGLIVAAGGIAAVSAALIAFGASSAIGGLLSFFGGDPIEKFLELADKSSGLTAAGVAIDTITGALEKLDSDKIDDTTDALKPMIKQLKNLSKLDLGQAAEFFKSLSGSSSDGLNVEPSTESQSTSEAIPLSTSSPESVKNVGSATVASLSTKSVTKSEAGNDAKVDYKKALQKNLKTEAELKSFEGGLEEGKDFTMVERALRPGESISFDPDTFEQETPMERKYANPETENKLKQLEDANRAAGRNVNEREKDMLIEAKALNPRLRDKKDPRTMQFARQRYQLGKGIDASSFDRGLKGDIAKNILSNPDLETEIPEITTQKDKVSPLRKLAEKFGFKTAENSSGAQLEMNQRENDQMKEAESLQAANTSTGNTAVVNNAGDQNITNTTINSDKHVDRTMDLIPAF